MLSMPAAYNEAPSRGRDLDRNIFGQGFKSFRLMRSASKSRPSTTRSASFVRKSRRTFSKLQLTPFLKLVKHKEFDEIFKILEECTQNGENKIIHEWLSQVEATTNASALHYILPHQPPIQLVHKLCSVLEDVENAVNETGQTPLHIASFHHCNVMIIQRLLQSKAAQVRDDFYRCPLHYACMAKRNKKDEEETALLLQLLVEAYPEARYLQDLNGHTPMDLAQLHMPQSTHVHLLTLAPTVGAIYPLKSKSRKSIRRRTITKKDIHVVDNVDNDVDDSERAMDVTVVTAQSTVVDEIPREIVRRASGESDNISVLENPVLANFPRKKSIKKKKDLSPLESCEI